MDLVAFLFSIWLVLACPVWGVLRFNQNPDMIEAADQFNEMAQNALKTSINTIIENSSKENNTCTLENLRVRRNWRAFTPAEKKSYIRSVRCMTEARAITPLHLAPGVRTRFDDFVAVHINQSYHVHRDVSLNPPTFQTVHH
jgi:tyrosinase